MMTRPTTKPTNDEHQDFSSPSGADPYRGVVRSNRQFHCQAQKLNTRGRSSPYVKSFGAREFWRIWVFPSRIWFSYIVTTWAVSTWHGTPYSTRGLSTSKYTIISSANAYRLEISIYNISVRTSRLLTFSRKPLVSTSCDTSCRTLAYLFPTSRAWGGVQNSDSEPIDWSKPNKEYATEKPNNRSSKRSEDRSETIFRYPEVVFEGVCWESNSTSHRNRFHTSSWTYQASFVNSRKGTYPSLVGI